MCHRRKVGFCASHCSAREKFLRCCIELTSFEQRFAVAKMYKVLSARGGLSCGSVVKQRVEDCEDFALRLLALSRLSSLSLLVCDRDERVCGFEFEEIVARIFCAEFARECERFIVTLLAFE